MTVAGCSSPRPDDNPADYVAGIAAARAAKDAQFQHEDDPIPASRKAEFLPLAHSFPPIPSITSPQR